MYLAPRSSQTFVNGVKNFLDFAFERKSVNGRMIKCPCKNCVNMKYQSRPIVLDHLICSGFRRDYSKWVYHGEDTTSTSTSTTLNEEEDILHHEMHDMLDDMFETEDGDGMDMHENGTENSQASNNKRNGFDDLLKEVGEKVWKVHESSPENEVSPPKKKASKILRVDIMRRFGAKYYENKNLTQRNV
ncbi:hypothetical protein QVD17_16139 [Tagetes erecta]|uniref:Transposase-associated domain-containing protein n=1 Tax=Tagetes erecta TaxID=13708 RepID=A0AAD8KR61_TARER|nr:hypothetical protein QVD17_16139 [Tagetes erecta]